MSRRALDSIAEIDGLRGIAIAMVMVHRLWPRDGLAGWGALPEAGWIGVDLFFVVSGFLITRILVETKDEPDYFKNFYARRVLRIFPLYYLLVCVILAAFPQVASPAWYLAFLGNIPEGLFGKDPPYWLAPVWSLAIEEQFYLTFPHVVRRLDTERLARLLVGLIVLAPIVRAVLWLGWPELDRAQYLLTPCRVDAIAAGCLLAVRPRWLARGWIALVAAGVALASGLDRTTAFGRVLGYSFVALGFAAVVGVVLEARPVRALRVAPLRYLGKLCFGLYLLHRPADTIVTEIAARYGFDATTGLVWVPVKLALAIGLASASWYLLERRMLSLKRRFVFAAVALAGCGSRAGELSPPDGTKPPIVSDARGDGAIDVPMIDAPPALTGKILYPADRRHSPITGAIAAHLASLAAHHAQAFEKDGDSITAMTSFATCFDGGPYTLGNHGALAATLAYYAGSYGRTSEAATGGWTAADLLAGPLDAETQAIEPRLAVVLIGTNDNRYGRPLPDYARDLWTIADKLLANGTVPILSTIPPIHSDPDTDARVPLWNLVVRAVAQGRRVPMIDFYRDLIALPGSGLSSDGIHPTVAPGGACLLDDADLQYGFNLRNLETLEALDRVRAALVGQAADASAPVMTGSGRAGDPYVASLPLVDLDDAAGSAPSPCGGQGVEYAVSLPAPANLDAYVVGRGTATLDVIAAGTCVASGAHVTTGVPAGALSLIVRGSGEYLLIVRATP